MRLIIRYQDLFYNVSGKVLGLSVRKTANMLASGSASRASYNINKPIWQNIRATAHFYENRSPVASQMGTYAPIINDLFKVLKAIF